MKDFDKKSRIKKDEVFSHSKECTCKVCLFIKNNNEKGFPIVYHLCPAHYSTWFHTHLPFLPFKNRMSLKIAIRFGLFKVVKVRYMDDSCDFCKLLDGGVGVPITPYVR